MVNANIFVDTIFVVQTGNKSRNKFFRIIIPDLGDIAPAGFSVAYNR